MVNIENLTNQEISDEIEDLEEQGFMYWQEWTMDSPRAPDRFELPSGEILDESELIKLARKTKLKMGDKNSIEIHKALRYYDLIMSEQFADERFKYSSFRDDKDISNCMKKYNQN